MATLQCPGCRAQVPATEGPTHPYIGASAGCWALYGEVLAGSVPHDPRHRLAVDAYAAQHPGVHERRSAQSVAVHLIGLCLVLERGWDPDAAIRELARHASSKRDWPWLTPPGDPGAITVLDAHAARDGNGFTAVAQAWARCVWDSWAAHHATVRAWIDEG